MVDLSTGLEWQRVGWGRNFGAPGNRPQYDCNGCSSLQDTAMLPGRGWSKPTSVQLNSLRARETCMPAILTFSDPFSASLLVGHWSQDSFDGCSPLPIRYWSCAGAICDGNANNAAACRCVRTWLP